MNERKIRNELNDVKRRIRGDLGANRTLLSSDTTYYVSPSGSDSTGSGGAASPWQSLTYAYDWIARNVDQAGYVVTIQLANGNYDAFVPQLKQFTGPVLFQGNRANPELTVIQGRQSGVDYTTIECVRPGPVADIYFNFLTLEGEADWANGYAILYVTGTYRIFLGKNPDWDNPDFGTINVVGKPYGFIFATEGAYVSCTASPLYFDIGDPTIGYMWALNNCDGYHLGTWTSNTDLDSDWATVVLQNLSYFQSTIGAVSGFAHTGQRYLVSANSVYEEVLSTPGSVAGAASTGGQVI